MADQAPDKVIDIPGVGTVAFPASMSDAQMNAAATKFYKDANPGKKQPPVTSWVDTAVEWAPLALGVAGGVAAGPVGAALGGIYGEAIRQSKHPAETKTEALENLGIAGVEQGALAGAAKGAKLAAPIVGRGMTATGEAMQSGAELLRHLIHLPGWKGKVAALAIKPLVSAGGKAVAAAGGQLEKVGAAEASRAALKARLARIPITERLAQIADEQAAASAPAAASSIADDVALIRESVSKGMPSDTAIRIVADGSAEYASALKRGFVDSLKASGVPIPEAVQKLMKAGSFAKLPQ